MKKFKFKSMRSRLTFWFLLLALIPLFFTLLIVYKQKKSTIEQDHFDKLTAIRDLKVAQVSNWLEEKLKDIKALAGHREFVYLKDSIIKEKKSKSDIQKYNSIRQILKNYTNNYNTYDEIYIINPKTGIIEISSNINSEGINKSTDANFQKAIKNRKNSITKIYHSKRHNTYNIDFLSPIIDWYSGSINKIIGILVIQINLEDTLYKLLRNRTGLGKTGETLIVNKDEYALNELRWHNNPPLQLKITAEPAVNASRGQTGIAKTLDYRGEPILAAYTHIPLTNWGFVAKQDLYELNKPIRSLEISSIIIFVFTTFLLTVITFLASKSISEPIAKIELVAKKVKSGDYSARNIINSDDELGSLAESINEMTRSIESNAKTQQGVRNISDIIVAQSSIKNFCLKLIKQLMRITKSNLCVFYTLNKEAQMFEHFVSIGSNHALFNSFDLKGSEGHLNNAVINKKIHYLENVPTDTIFIFKTIAGDIVPKEIITIPI